MVAFGVCLPVWLNYLTYCEKNFVRQGNRVSAIHFHIITYSFAFAVFMLPGYLLGDQAIDTCLSQTGEL